MKAKAISVLLLAGCLLAGCGGSTEGNPVAAPSSEASTSSSPTPLVGVSPPTAAAPNPRVTDTTFDGCAAITDAEVTSWGLDPTNKNDIKKNVNARNVRGCSWGTPLGVDTWFLKVYAGNGAVAHFEQPLPQFDRKERVQIGSRQGWMLHDGGFELSCLVVLPSQQGIATVQIDLGVKLQDRKFDACPRAVQLATAIEPKIP
ncbi:DUF3558 family protein [Mycobacteroides chelonae]|uniref:DUF3558 family protein n=1 Tax=Mycobacteroides chelonae TaxID=1774 RepID=UPI0009922C67|nr:DUF3558 family protein [Mycobacteroides chelonae]